MLSKAMQKTLNEQVQKEMYSANLYLSMCSYFKESELNGFANFFAVQYDEELFHAKKIFNYIHDAGGKATIGCIDKPQNDFKSLLDIFKITQKHEQSVTKSIHAIVKLAVEESDFTTHTFLQWFINEQLEEESMVASLLKKVEMIGDNISALYLLDTELSQRTFVPPTI